MSQIYPVHIAREIERRWQRLFPLAASPAAQNGDRDRPYLICKKYASDRPGYRGKASFVTISDAALAATLG